MWWNNPDSQFPQQSRSVNLISVIYMYNLFIIVSCWYMIDFIWKTNKTRHWVPMHVGPLCHLDLTPSHGSPVLLKVPVSPRFRLLTSSGSIKKRNPYMYECHQSFTPAQKYELRYPLQHTSNTQDCHSAPLFRYVFNWCCV
jgi:hypothetical protein